MMPNYKKDRTNGSECPAQGRAVQLPQHCSQGRTRYLAEGQIRNPNPRTIIPLWLESYGFGSNFRFNTEVNRTLR